MSPKVTHILSEINTDEGRGQCVLCGLVQIWPASAKNTWKCSQRPIKQITKHVLSEVDADERLAMCVLCGLVRIVPSNIEGKWICHTPATGTRQKHRLSDRDIPNRTATCKECGPTLLVPTGQDAPMDTPRAWRCKASSQKPHRKHLKDSCERCGFIPERLCQLDVHHLNGDHSDNRPENLQTLCANCHRLTYSKPV